MKKQYKKYIEAKEKIDYLVESKYPQGLIMKWKYGKYAGRECFIRRVSWEEDWKDKTLLIHVLVVTRSKDGKSFVNDNDSFHRRYRDIENFEVVK